MVSTSTMWHQPSRLLGKEKFLNASLILLSLLLLVVVITARHTHVSSQPASPAALLTPEDNNVVQVPAPYAKLKLVSVSSSDAQPTASGSSSSSAPSSSQSSSASNSSVAVNGLTTNLPSDHTASSAASQTSKVVAPLSKSLQKLFTNKLLTNLGL